MDVDVPAVVEAAPPARHVGLFRALLLAHAQMMVNRTRKGLGRRGVLGLAAVIVLLLLAAAPLFGTFGLLGYLFGSTIDRPLVAPFMGGVVVIATLGFGVMGGLFGGARQLTWDAYRAFPVPFRTLFFAETFASMGDLVVLGFIGVVFAMGVTFSWQSPVSTPLVFLMLAQLVLWVLFLQHLVGALAVTAVRKLRRGLIVLVAAAWAGVSVVAGAAKELHDNIEGAELERLHDLWDRIGPAVDKLPPVLAVRAIAAAKHGSFAEAARLELPMLVTTFLLGCASYGLLLRDAKPSPILTDTASAKTSPIGSTSSPRWAMARLHLHHILGSLQGRFGLVVPLITVVLVKGPLGSANIGAQFTLPGSVIYIALAASQFHFNQFGFDGQGVKTLLLLPVTLKDLLLGKTYALLTYAAAQTAFLLVMLSVLLHPSPRDVVASALLGACLAILQAFEGHWISVVFPRPLAMNRMNATGLSGANLLPLGVGMLNGAVFGGVYTLVSWLGPVTRAPVLVVLLGVLIVAYRRLLPRAADFVGSHREKVVEVLG